MATMMTMMTMMMTTVAAGIEQSYYRRSRRRRTTTTIPSLTSVAAKKSRFHVLPLLFFLIVGGTTNVLVSTAFVRTTTTTTNNNNNHYHDELSVRRKKATTTKTRTMTKKHLFSSSSRTSTTPLLCVVHPQQQRHDNINDEYENDNTETKELLSVAPMMGHTNRHYRYYYRLLSKRTYLYTEMMPSSQIVSAYNRAKEIYSNNLPPKSELESNSIPPTPTEIINLVQQVIDNPSLEYQSAALASKSLPYEVLTLHQLLATSCSQESPVVLQLGGNDPITLGIAAAIGAAWGRGSRCSQDSQQQNSQQSQSQHSQSQSHYIAINLNCGCPSNAVGGRAGGCSLMATPELVLQCVDSMKSSIDEIYNTLSLQEESSSSSSSSQLQSSSSQLSIPPPTITVKHRLGIRDAISYNATFDRLQNDDEAFKDVSSFIRTVSSNDSVSTFHVHARLGILGDFVDDTNDDDGTDEEEDDDDENNNNNKKKKKKIKQTLWVPTDDNDGATTNTNTTTDTNTENNNKDGEGLRIKIDHKREQEKARRRSRRSTIKNRDVPPLRPNVIYKLTTEFPHLDFVANGGITNMREVVKEVTGNGDSSVMGAMVGRTIINHPCSFAAADQLLWNANATNSDDDDDITSSSSSKIKRRPTRGDILLNYIHYCDEEEDRIGSYGASQQHMENLRRRLIAVPYHLFVGENGSDKYQRRIIKLKDKLQIVVTTSTSTSSGTTTKTNKNKNPNQMNKINTSSMTSMKASTILKGAMSFLPKATLDKCIDDYVEWDDIPKYDHLGGLKRGSALQRVVY